MKKIFLGCYLVGLFMFPSLSFGLMWADYMVKGYHQMIPLDDGRSYFKFTCKHNNLSGYLYRETRHKTHYIYYIDDLSDRRQTAKSDNLRRVLHSYCYR